MKAWICTNISNFFSPVQGAARLYAYIKKAGYDVSFKDFNQDAYFYLFSQESLEGACNRIRAMLWSVSKSVSLKQNLGAILLNSSNQAIRALSANAFLSRNHLGYLIKRNGFIQRAIGAKVNNNNMLYKLLSEQKFIISEIEKASCLIDKEFFNLPPEEFLSNFQVLLCAKAIIDAAYFPVQLDFGFGFFGVSNSIEVKNILKVTSDERFNYLIPFYNREISASLKKEQPEVIGVSITHASEFIPAFTLARAIKSSNPRIHICLGGAALSQVSHRIQKNPLLWEFFDSMVIGPGEYSFSQLLECLEKKRNLSVVSNLIYKEGGSIKESGNSSEFNLNDACTPEFVSCRPRSLLPLEASSGCYWGKCIFCYYPKLGLGNIDYNHTNNDFRIRDINLVIKDLRELKEKYNPLCVCFTDSSFSPNRLERIAEYNLKADKKINFTAFIRFEKEFKSKELCRKLKNGGFLGCQAGLESGSQRVNDVINKGVALEDIKIILRNFWSMGISTHLYSVIGIPTETKQDAVETFRFIKKYRKMLDLGWQIYPLYILECGPLVKKANGFGLHTRAAPNEFLTQVMSYDIKNGLSWQESFALSIRFFEQLKKHLQPFYKTVDMESYKLLLLYKKAYLREKD